MDAMLDTLVKLASLGVSGICIFGIFWVGWLLHKLPPHASPERHKSLRYFMGACVVMAGISGASGIANAWFNAGEINQLKAQQARAEQTIEEYKVDQTKNKEVAASLKVLLEEKEVAALATNSPQEVQASIRMLKKSIDRLEQPVTQ